MPSRSSTFTPEQLTWLRLIRDHIATSLSIELDDLDYTPFNQEGGLGKAHQLFGDQLPKLHLWKDIEELAKLVEFIFLERPGYPVKARVDIPGLRLRRCDGHLLAINSTELRERTRRNLSLDYFVPHKAIVYIREKALYRGKP